MRLGVGRVTDADNVGDVVFFTLPNVLVEVVGARCVHDEELHGGFGEEGWAGAGH